MNNFDRIKAAAAGEIVEEIRVQEAFLSGTYAITEDALENHWNAVYLAALPKIRKGLS